MPCISSSHTQHTVLQGCCGAGCLCPRPSAYQAQKYCECNDTAGDNIITSFTNQVCGILSGLTGFTGPGVTGLDAYIIAGATGRFNFTDIYCPPGIGTFLGSGGTGTQFGTVVGGFFVPITPAPTLTGTLNVYSGGNFSTTCATVTLF